MKIIIVDDSKLLRTQVKNFLQGSSYEIIGEANDGKTAIEIVKGLEADILLLDVVLPDISAKEVIDAIRLYNKNIKIIILSGIDAPIVKGELLNAGANGYIVKPVKENDLKDYLNNIFKS